MISLCIAIIIGMHENGHETLIVYMYDEHYFFNGWLLFILHNI